MSWESHLPQRPPKPPPQIPRAFSLRPPQELAKWIVEQAARTGRSWNEVLVAIVTAARNETRPR